MKELAGAPLIYLLGVVLTAEAKGTTCPCGQSNIKRGRIIGGNEARPNAYPWIVNLMFKENLQTFCGGAIINEKVAITAAHCTEVSKGKPLSIIAGTSIANSSNHTWEVERYIQHEGYFTPEYASETVNDIALLFLVKSLQFNSNVGPICLPKEKMNLDNKWVKILGWGRLGEMLQSSRQLMEADVQVKPFTFCKEVADLKEPQTQLCTLSPGKDSCDGDSGGPVAYLDPEINRFILIGILSFGSSPCGIGAPTYSTEVSAFLPWIQSKINSLGCQKV